VRSSPSGRRAVRLRAGDLSRGQSGPAPVTMADSTTDRERGEKRGLVSTDKVDADDADADANDGTED